MQRRTKIMVFIPLLLALIVIVWINSSSDDIWPTALEMDQVQSIYINGKEHQLQDSDFINELLHTYNQNDNIRKINSPNRSYFQTPFLIFDLHEHYVYVRTNPVREKDYPTLYVEIEEVISTNGMRKRTFYLVDNPALNNLILKKFKELENKGGQ